MRCAIWYHLCARFGTNCTILKNVKNTHGALLMETSLQQGHISILVKLITQRGLLQTSCELWGSFENKFFIEHFSKTGFHCKVKEQDCFQSSKEWTWDFSILTKKLVHFSSISIATCKNIWCPVAKSNFNFFVQNNEMLIFYLFYFLHNSLLAKS